MNFDGPYTAYVIGAYVAAFVLLGAMVAGAWRDWRRVRAAWRRIEGGRAP